MQEGMDLPDLVFFAGNSFLRSSRQVGQLTEYFQFSGDRLGGKDKVDVTGVHGAIGHARKFGRMILGKSDPALRLNRADPGSTICGGPGENDGNRIALVDGSQRRQEVIDGMKTAVLFFTGSQG